MKDLNPLTTSLTVEIKTEIYEQVLTELTEIFYDYISSSQHKKTSKNKIKAKKGGL